jgi:hypothetical protein
MGIDVDFDPGPGIDNRTTNGEQDIFLSKFSSDCDFKWALTWGGDDDDWVFGVAADGLGNSWVTGEFFQTVDFDPGPGVDEHISNGHNDAFLSKFNSNGSLQWALTWGGSDGDVGLGVAVDGYGNSYVTGAFTGTPLSGPVDFDPGPGVDNHWSIYSDAFMSKFDANGNFQWARTWGKTDGNTYDSGHGIAISDYSEIYVTGSFGSKADFYPGPEKEERTAVGGGDVFLSKFNINGEFQSVYTWGGEDRDEGVRVAVDGLSNAFVTGVFWSEIVDFDPGPGIDYHKRHEAWYDQFDVFLSKTPPDGNWW